MNINDHEWIAFTHACVKLGQICDCVYCGKTLITDEVADHLISYHPKQAKETFQLVRKRLDWEKEARWMTDQVVESLT